MKPPVHGEQLEERIACLWAAKHVGHLRSEPACELARLANRRPIPILAICHGREQAAAELHAAADSKGGGLHHTSGMQPQHRVLCRRPVGQAT